MDSDDCFEEFIKVDEGKENDESHPITNRQREFRTQKEQFIKIVDFMKEHNEQIMDKSEYAGLWDKLTKELNKIGPPMHSNAEWKKIWSDYKYRRSKGLPDIGSSSRQDDHNVLAELSNKLDIVIENQTIMVETQNIIVDQLIKSNSLLDTIAKK